MAARRPASADGRILGRENADHAMELRHAHHDLVVDRIDDAGVPGDLAAGLQVAADGIGIALARRPPFERAAAQHEGAMPRRLHVVLLEVLAAALVHQGHGGGIERNGRRRPGRGHVGRRRHGRRQERPHHLVADGVDHAAVEIAHDRHFALDQRIALLESRRRADVSSSMRVAMANQPRTLIAIALSSSATRVVLETLLAPLRHERHLGGDIGPRRGAGGAAAGAAAGGAAAQEV